MVDVDVVLKCDCFLQLQLHYQHVYDQAAYTGKINGTKVCAMFYSLTCRLVEAESLSGSTKRRKCCSFDLLPRSHNWLNTCIEILLS